MNRSLLLLLCLVPSWAFSQTEQPGLGPDFRSFRFYTVAFGHINPLNQDYLVSMLAPYGLPARQLRPASDNGWYMAYHHNRLYTNLILAYKFRDTEETPLYRSSLGQSMLGGSVGVNALKAGSFILSPYVGLRYNRYRNIIAVQPQELTLGQYLEAREVDLRLVQWSGALGTSFSFLFKDLFTFGFYVDYLQPLHQQPLLYSSGNQLQHQQAAFLKRYSFGLGMGFEPGMFR